VSAIISEAVMFPMVVFCKFFSLFGRHFQPFFANRIAVTVHSGFHPVMAHAAEQEAGKDEQAQRLPEINGCPTEYSGYEPIPQQHNDGAETGYRRQCEDNMSEKMKFSFHD
jgi:hypothetical protein